jgi:Glyoxalase-like domain
MLRLRQLALVADELDPVLDNLQNVFGLQVGFRDPGVKTYGLQNAVIPVNNQFVEVVSPIQENTAAGRYLVRRKGDGGYMVILQCDDHPARKARVDEMGVRKVEEHDGKDYSIMQLHPQDTGGSFLEIDVQVGGEDMNGPWMPAGKEWQKARTDRLSGIAAAEIQSPQPEVVADRWGKLLDIGPQPDENGNPTISLDNATIRFVAAEDGRGEGLAGIDLIAADREAVMAEADKRGLVSDDGTITICGMRFTILDG